jgi:hypothetical protein
MDYNETPTKGTIVDLKKNVSKIKTKIKEHSDEVTKIAYYSAGVVVGSVVVHHLNKKKMDHYQDYHDFAKWLRAHLESAPGEKFEIWSSIDKKSVQINPNLVKNIED